MKAILSGQATVGLHILQSSFWTKKEMEDLIIILIDIRTYLALPFSTLRALELEHGLVLGSGRGSDGIDAQVVAR